MTVYFIGAGPGAADLITLRGAELIAKCPVCLYAGSLVPEGVLAHCPDGATVIDTAPLNLDEIIELIQEAEAKGQDVARVHSGDPSLYGAVAEQIRRLKALEIDYTITPGVPAFAAMAAALGQELTLPNVSQSVVLTRTTMKSTAMPNNETIEAFAATGSTLAIHLSVRNMKQVIADLVPHYGEDCPVAVGYRVSWPDEEFIFGTLKDIREKVRTAKITRTALILVGHVLSDHIAFEDSALYHADHVHVLRNKGKKGAKAAG